MGAGPGRARILPGAGGAALRGSRDDGRSGDGGDLYFVIVHPRTGPDERVDPKDGALLPMWVRRARTVLVGFTVLAMAAALTVSLLNG
ncbi:hypothetical protein [Streptomyces sp. NPDC017529]|uniref:hypothetical protein n=1 Tax=Streptomyces sp. NPDC017529 TaxID=3365000 RepID=UPI0037B8C29A